MMRPFGLTAGVSCGCAAPNLQSRELHRRSRQLDAVLGPAPAPRPPNDTRGSWRCTVQTTRCTTEKRVVAYPPDWRECVNPRT